MRRQPFGSDGKTTTDSDHCTRSVASEYPRKTGRHPARDPPHKGTQAYGCGVSTLTRFARLPLQGPLAGSRPSLCCKWYVHDRQRVAADNVDAMRGTLDRNALANPSPSRWYTAEMDHSTKPTDATASSAPTGTDEVVDGIERPFQFGLRSLLMVPVVCAVVLMLAKWAWPSVSWRVFMAIYGGWIGAYLLVRGWSLYRRFRLLSGRRQHNRQRRADLEELVKTCRQEQHHGTNDESA